MSANEAARRPTTSFVILTRNQLEYTKACVKGIGETTPEPHEFVFVDNASTDGTLEYLRSIDGATVIDNDSNLGFGGACNQGIAASIGERILLLNNDVVPATGWLGALHDALDSDPACGIAGPRTNRIAGMQQVDGVDYDEESLDGLEEWAASWRRSHAGERTAIQRLIGFCLLIERAVVERIGGFDLRYEVGNFEDDDLCLRAGVAGFRCLIAHDSYVHHFGSRTFVGERIDYASRIVDNYRRFAQAWRLSPDEIDPDTMSYAPDRLLASNPYDVERHFTPIVAVDDSAARVELGQVRGRVVTVCCDRIDPVGTTAAIRHAFDAFGPSDDVTIAVRVDPRDGGSMQLLEQVADAHDDAGLPDVVVVQARDEDDRSVLRVSDEVVVAGRTAWARSLLARRMGVAVRSVD